MGLSDTTSFKSNFSKCSRGLKSQRFLGVSISVHTDMGGPKTWRLEFEFSNNQRTFHGIPRRFPFMLCVT
jgi:hypothetical protein